MNSIIKKFIILLISILCLNMPVCYANVDLAGVDEFLSVSSPPFLSDTQGTVIFWVNIDVLEFAFLAGIVTEGATDDEVLVFVNSVNGDLVLGYNDGGVAQFQATAPNGTVSANTWHQIAWTSDGSTMKFFVDAVEIVLTPTVGANTGQWFFNAANANIFSLGVLKRAVVSSYLNGTYSEVAVYSDDLTLAQIQLLYDSNRKRLYTQFLGANQQAYYPLDDGPDGTDADGDTFQDIWSGVNGVISGTTVLWEAEGILTYP